MKTLLTAFFTIFLLTAIAQTPIEKCLTPEMDTAEFKQLPWFDNNDYLEHFLDSIGYPSANSSNRIVGAPVRFWIPIQFWIYRDDNGNGGPDARQIRTLMDNLNRRYNQTNNTMIGFYMKCSPTFVNNSTHVTKTMTGASLLMAANNAGGAINIHIIGNFADNSAGLAIPFLNACMVPADSYTIGTANGDLAHEVGHIFGLVHTHQYENWNLKCLTECVSRTRTWPTLNLCLQNRIKSKVVCESTGDGLRDTQADNNLINNNACNYTVTLGNDPWDESYDNPPAGLQDRPNLNNIMSYNSATNCVDKFSRLQTAVMLYSIIIKKGIAAITWANPIHTFDSFEPDNEALSASNITTGQPQERNFHQQLNEIGPFPFITQCDVDWVRFVAPCSSLLNITTSALQGRVNANTRLTLFDNNQVQLAQNDDISNNNQFSNINWNVINGQVYFIRIENLTPNTTGYYSLIVGVQNNYEITGSSVICNGINGTLQISNLPTNASVTWSALPNNRVMISPIGNGSTANITRVTDGSVTITALISQTCYDNITLSKAVYVGPPYFGVTYKDGITDFKPVSIYTQNPNVDNIVCMGYNFPNVYINESPIGANNITWSVLNSEPQPNFIIQQQNANKLYFNWRFGGLNNPIGILKGSITNVCGTFEQTYSFSQINCNPTGGDPCTQAREINYYLISPNPAKEKIIISVSDRHAPIQCSRYNAITTESGIIFSLVNIYDNLGTLKKSFKTFNVKQASIQISDLIAGSYFIEIIQGDYVEKQQIIVQK